jgi:hypothetical protein
VPCKDGIAITDARLYIDEHKKVDMAHSLLSLKIYM